MLRAAERRGTAPGRRDLVLGFIMGFRHTMLGDVLEALEPLLCSLKSPSSSLPKGKFPGFKSFRSQRGRARRCPRRHRDKATGLVFKASQSG